MSDAPDRESKTEDPTEKKINDSLDKGQVPHSREATTLASMLAILIGAVFLVNNSGGSLRSTLESFIDQHRRVSHLDRSRRLGDYPRCGAMEAAKVSCSHPGPVWRLQVLRAAFLQHQTQLVARSHPSRRSSRISIAKG